MYTVKAVQGQAYLGTFRWVGGGGSRIKLKLGRMLYVVALFIKNQEEGHSEIWDIEMGLYLFFLIIFNI